MQPTELGREYISGVVGLRAAWAKHEAAGGGDEHPEVDLFDDRLGALGERIVDRPIRELANLVAGREPEIDLQPFRPDRFMRWQ